MRKRTRVDISRYRQRMAGRAPRGLGHWVFSWQGGGISHRGRYGEAKRRAIRAAATDGAQLVVLA